MLTPPPPQADTPEEEQGWITPRNVKQVASSLGRHDRNRLSAAVSVGCVTTDFAMQNVLLQMGLHVVSVDGRLIRTVKTFVLRCSACGSVTHKPEQLFCADCGYSTLHKIEVTTADDGSIEYHLPSDRPSSTRGTRFGLALPKGGRTENMVLVPDQKEVRQCAPSKKAGAADLLSGGDFVLGDSPFKQTDKRLNVPRAAQSAGGGRLQVGTGGRNPNEVRRTTGNRKKKK